MAAPPSQLSFLERAFKSRLVTEDQVSRLFPDPADRDDPHAVAEGLVKAGLLTRYHVQMLNAGKHRGFFLGPYKILRPIGQGGMGTVFLADHTTLSRKVAVKVLPPDKAKDKLTLERFNREARAAAALDHPNIVRLHDISQGNGVHFLVMEYVDGTDLQSLMAQTGPLHYAQAAQYVAQAAAGLHHAHEKGFIHRDIKPANLMLSKPGGGIKILDMGLARSFTDAADNLTANLAEGDIAGTVDYLSPEQAMNQPLDERSDIYSLGATFYALVAGYPPFKGTTAQKLMQHQLKEPPSVTAKLSGRVPQALSDVVSRMMAKKPRERYQSAADVIDALGPWLPVPTSGNIVLDTPRPGGGQTAPVRSGGSGPLPATPEGVEPRPFWKKPAVLAGAAVGLLLLVGGVIAVVAFAVTGGGAPTTTARQSPPTFPQAQPTPPRPSGGAASPVRADFAALPDDTHAVGHGGVVVGGGWSANTSEADAAGQLTVSTDDGVKVVTLTNTAGTPSVQLYQSKPGGTLAAGGAYLLRPEYKATEGTVGQVDVREVEVGNRTACPYSFKLQGTADKWEARAFEVEAARDYPTVFVIQNRSDAAGNKLSVRKVELVPVGGNPPAAPTPPTDDRVAYTLDLTGRKAFAVRRKARDTADLSRTGDGAPPAGWRSHSWEATCEHELFADTRDGSRVLGLRFVGGKAAGMMAVDGIAVKPNSTYDLTIEYQTPGEFIGDNGVRYRSSGNGGKLTLGGKLEKTDGKWVEKVVRIKTDASGSLQLEFHHNGPGGEANPLLLRKCKLVLAP